MPISMINERRDKFQQLCQLLSRNNVCTILNKLIEIEQQKEKEGLPVGARNKELLNPDEGITQNHLTRSLPDLIKLNIFEKRHTIGHEERAYPIYRYKNKATKQMIIKLLNWREKYTGFQEKETEETDLDKYTKQ